MADILIHGMAMPVDCQYCLMAHWSKVDTLTGCDAVPGKRYIEETDTEFWQSRTRPLWCPIVPLPEGHGRLIDADAFKAMCLSATKEAKLDFIRHEDWLKSCAITMSFCRDIDEQPTIVPAEGGTDNGF